MNGGDHTFAIHVCVFLYDFERVEFGGRRGAWSSVPEDHAERCDGAAISARGCYLSKSSTSGGWCADMEDSQDGFGVVVSLNSMT